MATTPDWIQAIGSIVAILGAALAILLQSRELREQRLELKLQREQLELQQQELARNAEIQQRIADVEELRSYLRMQTDLNQMAYNDPNLRVIGGWSQAGHELFAQLVYVNLWIALVHSRFSTTGPDDERFVKALEVLFDEPVGCVAWVVAWRRYLDEADPFARLGELALTNALTDPTRQRGYEQLLPKVNAAWFA